MFGILFLVVASLVGSFYFFRYVDRWMGDSTPKPQPQPQPNEDDPEFMRHVERQLRRRKD